MLSILKVQYCDNWRMAAILTSDSCEEFVFLEWVNLIEIGIVFISNTAHIRFTIEFRNAVFVLLIKCKIKAYYTIIVCLFILFAGL